MTTLSHYTLEYAAKIAGTNAQDIQRAIEKGELKARPMQNSLSYMIARDDLLAWLKKRKNWKAIQRSVRPRVLLVDRDQELTSLVRIDLQRGDRCEVSVATTADDLFRLGDAALPDVIAVCLPALLRDSGTVRDAIHRARARCHSKVLVYYRGVEGSVEGRPEVDALLKELAPDQLLAMPGPAQRLLDCLLDMAGIRAKR